jgi:hypothetical protein
MRLKSTLALLLLISFFSVKAQKPIILSEDSLKIGNGLLPSISVVIPEVPYEKTLSEWVKTLQSGTKSKVVTDNGEMTIFGAIIKDITEYPVNAYSILLDRDTALYLAVTFELKKDQYIERATGEAELTRAKAFLFTFAKEQYIELVEEQLKAEDKKLKDLEKELGSLEKDESGMEKSIRSNERTIATEKDRIIALNDELTSLSAAIEEHRRILSGMKPGEEKDDKEAYLKDLDKQEKQKMKAITKSENKVSKSEKAIEKAKTDIPKTGQMQDKFKDQIDAQEAVVQKFTDKLNTVKAYK